MEPENDDNDLNDTYLGAQNFSQKKISVQLFERQHVLPVYMCVCAFKQRDHV